MFDPIYNKYISYGIEPMDVDQDPTIAKCSEIYKNREPNNEKLLYQLSCSPYNVINSLVILASNNGKKIFPKKNGTKRQNTKYYVIKGQEILEAFALYKKKFTYPYDGKRISITFEYCKNLIEAETIFQKYKSN